MFPVSRRIASAVTTVAVFMVTSFATVWMTAETGPMRKKNTVSKNGKRRRQKPGSLGGFRSSSGGFFCPAEEACFVSVVVYVREREHICDSCHLLPISPE